MRINIKPLSVNKCWQGRRFKTPTYKAYEEEMMWLLPNIKVPKKDIGIEILVGLSSKLADIDNILKPLLDILQKKYNFNDKEINRILIEREQVKKGKEFIQFDIYKYN